LNNKRFFVLIGNDTID